MSKFIGIDYGSKRIGIALADTETQIATPYTTIDNDDTVVETITDICDKNEVELAVVGESKSLAGNDNPVMKQIRSFRKRFEEKSDIPVVYVPEFFTSAQARRQPEAGLHVDGSAAAIILQSYLDSHKQ